MSANSGFVALTEAQNNKVTSVNTAVGVLDAFVSEFTNQDYTAGDVTLTAAQFQAAVLFRATNLSVARLLILPETVKHLFVVDNTAGTNTLTVDVGTTQIVLAAASTGLFYTDGATNGLIQIGGSSGSVVLELGGFTGGAPATTTILFRFLAASAVDFVANLVGSVGHAGTAPNNQTDFLVQKNGVTVGTMRFANASNTATFLTNPTFSLASGDRLDIVSPANLNLLADLSHTLAATRG